jgi:hypothetical protein
MATQYSNKPIVLDGLVYALDFGNQKSYVSGSSVARSLNFVPYVSPLVTFSGAPIPTLTPNGIQFTNNFTVDTGNPFSIVSDSRAFTMMYTVRVSGNGLFATKDNGNQSSLHSVLNTNLGVVGWRYYNANIFNQRQYSFTPSTINHHTWTYSSGSYTYYINGIPVTGSDSATGGGVSLTSNLYLSGRSAAPDQFWSGSLFNFYLYDRVLTADEIYSNYLITAQRIGLSTRPKPYTVDPDVYNFLTATNITDGIITSSLDTFVRGLKSASLWDKMIAIYPFVGTGSVGTNLTGSHRWNLKEATVLTSSFNGSWNGSTSGSTPSGSNTFISVPLSPTRPTLGSWTYPNYSSSNVHISILSYDTPVSRSYLMGTGMTEDLAASTLAGDYGTPAAAYSVRKVRTAYTGALMDVRRSYDNVTSSIGYVSNGDLDTGSLLDWVVPGRSTLPGAYSGLAAAYSLRRVSGSYTGSAIDVRRASDNYTFPIGFTGSGDLDTRTLLQTLTTGSNIMPNSNNITLFYSKDNVQVTSSAISGPFGIGSGSFLNETTANNRHVVFDYLTSDIGGTYNVSAFVKKQERRYIALANPPNGSNNAYVVFDLDTTSSISSGSTGTGFSVLSSSIHYVDNGWFRLSFVSTTGRTDFYPALFIQKTPTFDINAGYVGEPGTGSYVYGFQYSSGSILQPYIETTGTARYNQPLTSSMGYVTQWYDQSGNNRHATQTTASSQPLIVSSGSLVTENGKPAVSFNGTVPTYLIHPWATGSTGATVFDVFSTADTSWILHGNGSLYFPIAESGIPASSQDNVNITQWYKNSITQSITTRANVYTTYSTNSNVLASYLLTANLSTQDNIALGNLGNFVATYGFTGKIQESLWYTTNYASEATRSLIENNINNYYNIYTGSNHGFVARWYDQSGNNRHATQTATGSQPVIVLSGSILTTNNKPNLNFDGVDDNFSLISTISSNTAYTAIEVNRRTDTSVNSVGFATTSGQPYVNLFLATTLYFSTLRLGTGYFGTYSINSTDQQLLFSIDDKSSNLKSYLNQNLIINSLSGFGIATFTDYNNIGIRSGYTKDVKQELIFYSSDQSSNREAISYGINNYYNIYPQTSSFATSSFTISAASGSVSASLNNRLTSGIPSSGPLGLITVSRTGSNSLTIARNGVTSSFAVPASGALSTGIYLGAINNNGLALGNSPLGISFASVGTGLTGAETLNHERLVWGLQYNLGRNRNIVTQSLVLNLDAGNRISYPGSGNTWFDLSGNNNNGTLVNEPTFNPNNEGSIVFDGVNDYVEVPNNVTLNSNIGTISVWFNSFTPLSGNTSIVGKHDTSNSNNGINIIVNTNSVSGQIKGPGSLTNITGSSFPANTWNNYTIVYTSGISYSSYLNGVLLGTNSLISFTVSTQPLRIARSFDSFWSIYKGQVANLLLYNRALTQAEVLQNFNATRGRFGV